MHHRTPRHLLLMDLNQGVLLFILVILTNFPPSILLLLPGKFLPICRIADIGRSVRCESFYGATRTGVFLFFKSRTRKVLYPSPYPPDNVAGKTVRT